MNNKKDPAKEYISKELNKKIYEMFNINLDSNFSSDIHEPSNLTLDKLLEVDKILKRSNFLYVAAAENIPDDAHGILFVRKEDYEKWKKKD